MCTTVLLTGLDACSDDERGGSKASGGPGRGGTTAAPGEAVLIRTRIHDFEGTVLEGSVIGDTPFCPGGKVVHEGGSPQIGFPAVNVFQCAEGQLRIGFGPGPDQMDQAVQTSAWEVLGGTGRFAGATGAGEMEVRFKTAGASVGEETFEGRIVVR